METRGKLAEGSGFVVRTYRAINKRIARRRRPGNIKEERDRGVFIRTRRKRKEREREKEVSLRDSSVAKVMRL